MNNAHVILYWRWNAWLAERQSRWMDYEYFRQWHQDELNLASNPVYPVV